MRDQLADYIAGSSHSGRFGGNGSKNSAMPGIGEDTATETLRVQAGR
jgi:hypothetical protein